MPRTNETLVRGILQGDYVAGDVLGPFMDSANVVVTDECTASGYTDDRLELIERWLSAHLYAVSRRPVVSQGVTGAAGVNQAVDRPKLELGFRATTYGQQALRLDTAGNLAGMDNEMDVFRTPLSAGRPRIVWLGRRRHHHH